MATDNNEKNAAEIRRAMTEDKDKIAAALNNALADTKGNPIKTPVSKKSAGRPKGQGKKAAPKAENKSNADGDGISPETKQFAEACYNLKIDAKMCHEESSKMEDPSIEEYVRSINKKIFDETRQGGYSTNVQFRVLPPLHFRRHPGRAAGAGRRADARRRAGRLARCGAPNPAPAPSARAGR